MGGGGGRGRRPARGWHCVAAIRGTHTSKSKSVAVAAGAAAAGGTLVADARAQRQHPHVMSRRRNRRGKNSQALDGPALTQAAARRAALHPAECRAGQPRRQQTRPQRANTHQAHAARRCMPAAYMGRLRCRLTTGANYPVTYIGRTPGLMGDNRHTPGQRILRAPHASTAPQTQGASRSGARTVGGAGLAVRHKAQRLLARPPAPALLYKASTTQIQRN